MKNRNLFMKGQIVIAFGLFFMAISCDSFVEVALPSSQLTSVTVFQEPATANAAMTDIYAKLRDNGLITGNGSGINVALGAYADELEYYGATGATTFFYNNTILPSNATIQGWWSDSYNQIYAANAVYEGVSTSTNLSKSYKDQLMGEALFVRALVHFYLVNIFGDIPYITTTNYVQNQNVSRTPATQVYTNIIKDLETAQALLPSSYFGGLRVRPNRLVATALLARVHLYNEDFAKAINTASLIINETETYRLEPNLDLTFLKESPSTIWQLIPQVEGRNTDEGAIFIFNVGPPSFVAMGSELINSFETGDLRKLHWIKEVGNGNTTWYHVYKYKEQTVTTTTKEYAIALRLPEQYLIRAEAKAKLNDLIGAREDLNRIRNLAGLSDITNNKQEEILSAILQERKVELFTENGHRFFDLKRMGKLNNLLSGIKLGWDTADALLPLPESELLLNPNLAPQNPGY
jgi:starch-binding outer membrane protein, SusD/RagB family